jgi:hypothetical protein
VLTAHPFGSGGFFALVRCSARTQKKGHVFRHGPKLQTPKDKLDLPSGALAHQTVAARGVRAGEVIWR